MIKFGESNRQKLIEKIKKHAGLSKIEDLSCLSADALDSIWYYIEYAIEEEKMPHRVVSIGRIPEKRNEIIDSINGRCDTYGEDFSCVSIGGLQKIYKALFPWQFKPSPF